MKVCVLNFSGNVGKSTIAAHLLQPRLNAQVFSVESLNVDASSDGVEVARLRGKHYNDLLQRLMKLDDAIVDVGSSNVEDFLKMMQHYADSQEEFDLFVVPVVKDGKQQADTVNTIRALRAIGVPAAKILVLINKVETDDDLRTDFAGVFGFCASGEATIPEGGVIFANELFAMLKSQQLSISALNDDATDYRQRLRAAANEDEQDAAIQMIAICNSTGATHLAASKALMAMLGVDCGPVRLPLVQPSAAQLATLRTRLNEIGFFDFAGLGALWFFLAIGCCYQIARADVEPRRRYTSQRSGTPRQRSGTPRRRSGTHRSAPVHPERAPVHIAAFRYTATLPRYTSRRPPAPGTTAWPDSRLRSPPTRPPSRARGQRPGDGVAA